MNSFIKHLTKKILFIILVISLFSLGYSSRVQAQNEKVVNIYFFYGQGCPHCAKEREYLYALKEVYSDNVNLYEYEVYNNQENVDLLIKVGELLNTNIGGVPFVVVGEKYLIGYESHETTGKSIQNEIERCIDELCVDNLSSLLIGENEKSESTSTENIVVSGTEIDSNSPLYIDTIIFGDVDLKKVSLPIATIIIAFVDGFNPCAMWILIFLITMLIDMKDKRKLYLLGTSFILTSGIVYFFFLTAWLNLFQFLGFVYWIKIIIGIVAIVSGVLHVKNVLTSKGGCHATNEKQRESIIHKVQKVLGEKSYALAILGIISLAISVNLIEVVCSAGLPAVYTNLLSSINLSPVEYYLYLILYVIVFMLDDLIVFFIAIKTFEVTGIAKKYTKWSGLIGGIIIIIIGIILIVKPELLMFG